jgi:hypothetical protein
MGVLFVNLYAHNGVSSNSCRRQTTSQQTQQKLAHHLFWWSVATCSNRCCRNRTCIWFDQIHLESHSQFGPRVSINYEENSRLQRFRCLSAMLCKMSCTRQCWRATTGTAMFILLTRVQRALVIFARAASTAIRVEIRPKCLFKTYNTRIVSVVRQSTRRRSFYAEQPSNLYEWFMCYKITKMLKTIYSRLENIDMLRLAREICL